MSSSRGGHRADTGKELFHGLTAQGAGNTDQPRATVEVRPFLELDRRVCNVLDEMNDDRPAAFCDREQALDAKEIGPAQCRQHRHCLFEARRGQRFFKDQGKAAQPVRMLRLAEVKASPRRKHRARVGDPRGLSP